MTNMMTILPGGDETMEAALVTPFDQVPDLVEDHEALVEHRHLDVSRKDPGEIGAGEAAEEPSLEDGSPHISHPRTRARQPIRPREAPSQTRLAARSWRQRAGNRRLAAGSAHAARLTVGFDQVERNAWAAVHQDGRRKLRGWGWNEPDPLPIVPWVVEGDLEVPVDLPLALDQACEVNQWDPLVQSS